jgi:mannosyltransferase OCH1-like enzyme
MDTLYLPTYVTPRTDYLIQNKFEIINNIHNDHFIIVFYYIEDYKAHIKIRRVDSDFGWKQNLTLRLYSNGLKEIIQLGSSDTFYKEMDIYTNIILYKFIDSPTLIPKIIMQTNDKDTYDNIQHYNSIQLLLDLNPSYTYYYFNGSSRRQFIQTHMDESILEAYDKIVSKTYKSDFFRYIFLYVIGGCYFDHKFLLKESISKFLPSTNSYMLCQDLKYDALQNGILFSEPNQPFLYHCIQKIVRNVHTRYYGSNALCPTGPKLLFQCAKSHSVHLEFTKGSSVKNYKEETIVYRPSKKIIGYRYYNQYYQKRKCESYSELYDKKLIYSQQRTQMDIYSIIILPSHKFKNISDSFQFSYQDSTLTIQRIDCQKGWNLDLKIQMINNTTHQDKIVFIGSSPDPSKTISFVLDI